MVIYKFHCQQAHTCCRWNWFVEKLQRTLKFRDLNCRRQRFTVRPEISSAEWPYNEAKRWSALVWCTVCDCADSPVCKNKCVCMCVGGRRWSVTLQPGDNSDEWTRQASNEALVTDWERTHCTPSHFSPSVWRERRATGMRVWRMKKNEGKRRWCEEQHGGGAFPQLSPRWRKFGYSKGTKTAEMCHLIYYTHPARLYITGDSCCVHVRTAVNVKLRQNN